MTRKEKPKDYFSNAYFNYLVDISEYRGNKQRDMIDYDLNKDLYEKVTKEMKKNPNLLEELNYDNPPIEMGNIYIIKLDRWNSGLILEYADGMEWSDYWDDEVTRYTSLKFSEGYLAVIKLPPYTTVSRIVNPDTQWQRTEKRLLGLNPNNLYGKKDENYYFSIVLPDDIAFKNPLVYSRKNSYAKNNPIYFAKGNKTSPVDDEDGKWSWKNWSSPKGSNEYDFPAGSTWALLRTWPDFLNWGNAYPFSTK